MCRPDYFVRHSSNLNNTQRFLNLSKEFTDIHRLYIKYNIRISQNSKIIFTEEDFKIIFYPGSSADETAVLCDSMCAFLSLWQGHISSEYLVQFQYNLAIKMMIKNFLDSF